MSSSTPPMPFGPDPAAETAHTPVNGAYYPAAPFVYPNPYAPAPPLPRTWADRWYAKLLVAVLTAGVVFGLGAPLGWLWSAVSPRLPVRVESDGLYLVDVYGEQRAAQDSLFVLISIGAGIVIAVLAWIALRRFRGVPIVAALAVGGGAAGWFMWWIGHNVGRAHADALAKKSPVGTVLRWPIDLRIKNPGNVETWHGWPVHVGGVLMYLGVAAVLTYWLLALVSSDSTLNIRRRRAGSSPTATSPADEPVESRSDSAN